MSTNDYINSLTIDQLRYFREVADEKIKSAELKPKKIVWVIGNNSYNEKWFREEDYEKALECFINYFKANAKDAVEEFIEDRPAYRHFSLPKFEARYENETEYEEWFN